jgi:ribonucleoside-diphosphate reductase alpha chain
MILSFLKTIKVQKKPESDIWITGLYLSAFFWRRFKNKEDITFFDPNEVPDLYEAFYKDTALFEELYVKYENVKTYARKQ